MSVLTSQTAFWVALSLLVVMLLMPVRISSAQTALPESSRPVIEYGSVSAAHAALKAKPDVVFNVINGWEVATDKANLTIWSFAPRDYASYPAVVKRQVMEKSGQVSIQMSVQCESSKNVCDELVRTFSRMNGFSFPEHPNGG